MSETPAGRGPTKRHIGIQMTALGLEFSASVIGGMIGGWWLDGYFGTKPWLFLFGTFAGLGTSFLRIIQLTRQFDRARDHEARDDDNE
ncbi:MAG: AtpZ/AtpI family protein [bacterium]